MASPTNPVEAFDLVIFGGTGDLARRKILPALYRRFCAGQMGDSSQIIGAARTEFDDDSYRAFAREAITEFARDNDCDCDGLEGFLAHLRYVTLDAMGDAGWDKLRGLINDEQISAFYFSVGPRLFGPLAERLQHHGLAGAESRIVVEKPFGRDLQSAKELNATLAR